MPVRRVVSHPRVTENTGCVAVARGPVVYCVESADHPGADIHSLELPDRAEIEAEIAEDLLEGVVVLKAEGVSRAHPGGLYRTAPRRRGRAQEVPITMVPYFAWANREPGAMRVWLPRG